MNKNTHIKLILLLSLLAISISSFSADKTGEKTSLRIDFDGSIFLNNDGQLFLPYGVGIDVGNHVHENLCINLGAEYWSTEQNVSWTNSMGNSYYWNGEMINLIFNASLQFITPAINLKNDIRLTGFIEPGLGFEPFPIALINYERTDNYYYSTANTADKGIAPYLTWNMKAGLHIINSDNIYFDTAYMFSNMDLYKVYRDMKIDNQLISNFVPSSNKYNGLRFTLGVKF